MAIGGCVRPDTGWLSGATIGLMRDGYRGATIGLIRDGYRGPRAACYGIVFGCAEGPAPGRLSGGKNGVLLE